MGLRKFLALYKCMCIHIYIFREGSKKQGFLCGDPYSIMFYSVVKRGTAIPGNSHNSQTLKPGKYKHVTNTVNLNQKVHVAIQYTLEGQGTCIDHP